MRPHGGRELPRWPAGALLCCALVAGGCSAFSERMLTACASPAIGGVMITSNPANVLSAVVRAEVRAADSILAYFGTASIDSATPATSMRGESVHLSILGLRASTSYRAQLVAFNACGRAQSEIVAFTTNALPADLPSYTATGSAPSPGYVVFAAGSYGLVIDNTGRVVWYHRFPNGAGLAFQAQPNGMYTARPTVKAGEIANWIEVGIDGTIGRTLGCARGLQPRAHDMIAAEDGSYWLLCDETRVVDLSAQGASPAARVLGAGIQHRSASGDVLFEWSAFDHLAVELDLLSTPDRTAAVINWTHANALDVDRDGTVLLSFRNLNEITKIDGRTGAVLWRLGGSHNQFALQNGALPAFVHQHGVRAPGDGSILLLDNLGQAEGTRAERYMLDPAHGEAVLRDSFSSSRHVIGEIGGSAQRLPNGHTLVSFGNGNGVEEYDASGGVVWRLMDPTGYVFRAQRIHSLYTPGVGDAR